MAVIEKTDQIWTYSLSEKSMHCVMTAQVLDPKMHSAHGSPTT